MPKVFCKKYKQNLDGMVFPPMPGQLGKVLMENYSQKAWEDWLNMQTMLINENRLDLSNKESRKWLNQQMQMFFENKGHQKPKGFVPE